MNQNAIETTYKGYNFRSRTEARWAVLLDAAGVNYEYEKEGYQLPSGLYLPDFYLPALNLWLEVKGEKPTSLEITLCQELANVSNVGIAVSVGTPGQERLGVYCSDATDSSAGTGWWLSGGRHRWCHYAAAPKVSPECPGEPHWCFDADGGLVVCSGNALGSRKFHSPGFDRPVGMSLVEHCLHTDHARNRMLALYTKARSARFEYRETPDNQGV
jgi:hypothetical protein